MRYRRMYSFIEKEAYKLVFYECKTLFRTVMLNATTSRSFSLVKKSGSAENYQQEAFRITNRKHQGLTKLRGKIKQERVTLLKSRLRKGKPELSTSDIDSMMNGLWQLLAAAQHRTRRFFLPEYEGDRFAHTPLQMDGKWWAWNLALASLPALLLMLIFEYHIPEYEAFFAEVNRQQKNRLMEAMGYKEDQHLETEQKCDSGIHPNELEDENQQEPSSSDLIQRIERLERLLEDKRKEKLRFRYELERLDQSGVQNRIEDRMIEKIAEERKKENTQQSEIDMPHLTGLTGRLIAFYNKLREEGMIIRNDLHLLLNYIFKEGIIMHEHSERCPNESEDVPSGSESVEKDEGINNIAENAQAKETGVLYCASLVSWLSTFFS